MAQHIYNLIQCFPVFSSSIMISYWPLPADASVCADITMNHKFSKTDTARYFRHCQVSHY